MPERKFGLELVLERAQAELFEPQALRMCKRCRVEVGQRSSPPERERRRQLRGRLAGVAGGERGAAVVRESLEAADVERVGLDREQVARSARDDSLAAERLPQAGDVALQSRGRGLGRAPPPELIDQPVAWNDELWGERPPETAATALQGYVSGLRKTLGSERIVTRAPGYLLSIEPDALDVGRFERLAHDGRAALAAGNARQASAKLSAALALWRGRALADLDSTALAHAESLRLEELRLSALEDKFEAELALGHHAETVADLEALVSQHPLRERLRGQLMLALYRCGRQADALEAYQEMRRLLVGELGLEPGAALRNLEQAILNHDPALEPTPTRAAMRRRPRRRTIAALGALVIAAAAATAAVLLTRTGQPTTVVPDSLVRIDPRTNKVVDVIRVGRSPGKVVAGYGSVWVVDAKDETLTRVSARSGRADLVGGLRLAKPAGLVAAGGRGLFVGSFAESELVHIDPSTLEVDERLELPGRTALFVAAGAGSLWITQPPADFHAW